MEKTLESGRAWEPVPCSPALDLVRGHCHLREEGASGPHPVPQYMFSETLGKSVP
jgi:hypothetical protein